MIITNGGGARIEGTTCTPTKLDNTQVDQILSQIEQEIKRDPSISLNHRTLEQNPVDGITYARGAFGGGTFEYVKREGFPPKLTLTINGVQTTILNPERHHRLADLLNQLNPATNEPGNTDPSSPIVSQCTPTEMNEKELREIVFQFEEGTEDKPINITNTSNDAKNGGGHVTGYIGPYHFYYQKIHSRKGGDKFDTKLIITNITDGKSTTIHNPENFHSKNFLDFLNHLNMAIVKNPHNVITR